jgi:hypothetical protein
MPRKRSKEEQAALEKAVAERSSRVAEIWGEENHYPPGSIGPSHPLWHVVSDSGSSMHLPISSSGTRTSSQTTGQPQSKPEQT